MSNTPRTNANLIHGISASEITTADFARTLERELSTAKSRIAELEKEIDETRFERNTNFRAFEESNENCKILTASNAALTKERDTAQKRFESSQERSVDRGVENDELKDQLSTALETIEKLRKERNFERKEKECWIFNAKELQRQANALNPKAKG